MGADPFLNGFNHNLIQPHQDPKNFIPLGQILDVKLQSNHMQNKDFVLFFFLGVNNCLCPYLITLEDNYLSIFVTQREFGSLDHNYKVKILLYLYKIGVSVSKLLSLIWLQILYMSRVNILKVRALQLNWLAPLSISNENIQNSNLSFSL